MNVPPGQLLPELSARIAPRLIPPQLQAINNWDVIRHLGSGSTAHVWLMQHEKEDRYAACKTPKLKSDTASVSQEAELAQALAHENLIRYLGTTDAIGQDTESRPVTFWEFLPSGSLSNLIAAGGRLSLAETVTVLVPMIQVAQYLHGNQIVHGDISPSNILFDLNGRPVLIDFGASRATALSSNVAGTPGFIAPELDEYEHQIVGLGVEADVYSLAAVGWFCLTGQAPGPTFSRIPLATLNNSLAADIIELLEASLSDEPALRPSMERLLNAVQHWTDPEPVDLFAAVDEHYELLLPTRKSTKARPRPKAQRRVTGHTARSKCRSGRSRRILLAISGILLCIGVLSTIAYASDKLPHPSYMTVNQAFLKQDDDFQAVVDALAKARTTAWTTIDPTLVDKYAVEGSRVYIEDYKTLESLAATGSTLDGIRMRAAVASAERTGQNAIVSVQWQTDQYTQYDPSGTVVETFPSSTDNVEIKLLETQDGWKFDELITD